MENSDNWNFEIVRVLSLVKPSLSEVRFNQREVRYTSHLSDSLLLDI